MNEKSFLAELKRTFDEFGVFWYKIPDLPVYKSMSTRFNPPKPFDAIMLRQGVPYAIEAKYLPDFKSFGIRNLTQSQVEGLCDWQAAGGKAFVFLNVRRKSDASNDISRINRLYVFDWSQMRASSKNYNKAELMQLPYSEGSKGVFDLDQVFKRCFD